MSDVWRCCNCGTANLDANADVKCPACNHTRCSNCKIGQSPLPGGHPDPDLWSRSRLPREDYQGFPRDSAPVPYAVSRSYNTLDASRVAVPQFSLQRGFDASRSGASYGTASIMPAYPLAPKKAHPGTRHRHDDFGFFPPTIQTPSTPSTRGFWYCCASNDRHLNNPSNAPDRCSQCEHMKCDFCTVLKS